MPKLIYFVACTADHFIAREDGSYDFFLNEGEHLIDLADQFPEMIPGHVRGMLGITAANRHFDTVLMGYNLYQWGLRLGMANPYPHLRQYLFSRTLTASPSPDIQLVSEAPAEVVRSLKREPGRDIWLSGGSQLAAALFDEIDELILKVNPVLIGTGIPLFALTVPVPATRLDLLDLKAYPNGFMLIHYRLRR